MNQAVNIPFSHRLEAGDSSFVIKVPQKFVQDPNRLFGFTTLTLCPDYYSKQAFKLNMDSEKELQSIVSNDFYLEVEYEKTLYESLEWTCPNKNATVSSMLKAINTHFDQNKPAGQLFPPVVFDWFHINSLARGVDVQEFHQNIAKELYGEAYDPQKHLNLLPAVFQGKHRLNNMMFPTVPGVLDFIRIRMSIGTNAMITFSNAGLLTTLGMPDSQIPAKVKNQIQFKNDTEKPLHSIIFQHKPLTVATGLTTKLHVYPLKTFVISSRGTFSTTKERERNPDQMAQDYSPSLATVANLMNLEMSLEHNAAEKKFKIVFPPDPHIRVSLKMPSYVSHKLGYGHIDLIRPNMTNESYKDEINIDDIEKTARVLVYDAGMVVVSLDQRGSNQTHQFTNTFMAILQARKDGTMTTDQGVALPRVPVAPFNPNLEFVLSKFNENNEPIPLDWKTAAYIRGVLVGNV